MPAVLQNLPPPATLTIYLLRHGEASHNHAERNRKPGESILSVFQRPEHHDASLTDKGIEQCKHAAVTAPTAVKAALEGDQNNLVVITSTLSRTIQTAQHALPGVRIIRAFDCVREWAGAHTCDSRLPISALEAKYSGQFDSFEVQADQEEDLLDVTAKRESKQQMFTRVRRLLSELSRIVSDCAARNHVFDVDNAAHPVIVIVSHNAFFRTLLASIDEGEPENRALKNCEWREIKLHFPFQSPFMPETPLFSFPLSLPPSGSSKAVNSLQVVGPHHMRLACLQDLASLTPAGLHDILPTLKDMACMVPYNRVAVAVWPPVRKEGKTYGPRHELCSEDVAASVKGWIKAHGKRTDCHDVRLMDATHVLSPIKGAEGDAGWEVVGKECLFRQVCVLVCLPCGDGKKKPGMEDYDREVSSISHHLHKDSCGLEAYFRLDVMSL